MSRTVSESTSAGLYDESTGEVFLMLVTLDHDDLVTPIRLTNNAVNIDSNGDTYLALPFEITLAHDSGDTLPRLKAKIDNVEDTIVSTIRSLTTAPTISVNIVRGDDPDTIEISFPNFTLADARYSAVSIEGEFTLQHYLNEPFPSDSFTPARFPGLF